MKRILFITAFLLGFGVYTFAQIIGTPVPVLWSNTSLSYNGYSQRPTATAVVNGITRSLNVDGAQTNAGTYTASLGLNLALPSGYYYTNTSTSFTIARLKIIPQWGSTSLTYNGYGQTPTATAQGILGENLPLSVSGAQTYVGTGYTATAAFYPTNNNYEFYKVDIFDGSKTTFEIIPASISVNWNTATPLYYNGYPQAPTATATGVLGENLPLNVTGTQTYVGGPYTASAVLVTTNNNYTLSNTTTPFVINRATVPVVWGITTLIYTGSPQAPLATATGVLNENLPLNISGAQIYVGGPYTATAAFTTTNNNYTLSNTTVAFTITQAPADTYTVQWDNTSLTYTGYSQTPTATASNGFGATIAINVAGAQTNAGTGYTATASLSVPNNSISLLNGTTLFEITPATVSVRWGATMLSYTGSPQAPNAIATGVLNENLPLTVTGAQTNVGGPYTATAALATSNNNYSLNNITTTFTIIQQSNNNYTVQWNALPLTYNGNAQAPTATATNSQGQSVAITVTGAQRNVGTGYTATAALAVPNSSITLLNPTTLFDITPAPLAVAAVNETIVYGQTPTLAYTVVSGQLFGSDAFTGALAVEMQNAPYPVGVHSIVQGTLTAGSNYLISFTKGTLTVRSSSSDDFDIIVNGKSSDRRDGLFYGEPAENGEDQATVYVLANPGEAISIGGVPQNPRTVALPDYGDNNFTVTVTPQNGASRNYTLVIERYYDLVYFEYPDVPTISCNPQTNGGFNFSAFQWYREGEVITGAIGPYIQVKDNAFYHCELTPNISNSAKFRTINVRSLSLRASGGLTAFPNPTQGKVTVQWNMNGDAASNESTETTAIQVFDVNGALVLQPATNPFDMSALPQGMYFIKMNDESVKVVKTN